MTQEELLPYHKIWMNDIHAFAEEFFPHLLTRPSAPFHLEIYKALGTGHRNLVLEVFRGGAKSTICLIIKPIHFSLYKQTGDITLISKSESFVLNEINRKIKYEFENNEKLRNIFGDQTTEKWSETYFVLKNGIAFEGLGIGGQLRGGRRGLIVLDDLEDEESAISEDQRDKLKRRIGKEIAPKLLPEGEMVYVGTPVHQLCYIHQVYNTPNNGWTKLHFPVYKDGKQEVGLEQWKEMYNHSFLQGEKSKWGSNYFSSEYLCNPIVDENCPIKEDQIRYWDTLPKQYSCVIAVDPAYSEDATADYKVATIVAIDQAQNRYLLTYLRTHDTLGEFQDGIINLFLQHKNYCTGLGVPNSGVEKSFFDSFMKKCEERKVYPPVIELKNAFIRSGTSTTVRNKQARVTAALQPLFQSGKFYIRPEHLEAREELLTIGQSRHDDIVDCLAYAEQILQPIFYDYKEAENRYEELEEIDHGATGYE
jgi:phage terminase large subunit-like protein